jgi:FkbM family methyltransferase
MYSQNDEEQYILSAVGGVENKRLLDIGAWDPKKFSNSRALIESGWDAVLIEPSPQPLEALLQAYGGLFERVQIVSAAVSPVAGWAEMRITADAVSTMISSVSDTWAERGGYYGRLIVPAVSLADIMNRFGGFDFVNIDAEGVSADLFIDLMATQMLPRCVCVEHDSRLVELGTAAARRGYVQTYVSQENAVFARGR